MGIANRLKKFYAYIVFLVLLKCKISGQGMVGLFCPVIDHQFIVEIQTVSVISFQSYLYFSVLRRMDLSAPAHRIKIIGNATGRRIESPLKIYLFVSPRNCRSATQGNIGKIFSFQAAHFIIIAVPDSEKIGRDDDQGFPLLAATGG